MIRPDVIVCAWCASSLALAVAVRADDGGGDVTPAPAETIVIEGRAPERTASDRRERALGDAPFVTVLRADDHAPTASVADALATSAGAQTRSLGGLGAYQSVSVRGAAPGHTSVLVDGVPLARLAAVTTDLGRFTAGAFGEIELYRGAVPLELGGAGVGGAVNLVTQLGRGPRGERLRASLGGGSFGARHARVRYGDDHGGARSATTLAYQGAAGDYTYFSDGGTPLNPNDDGFTVRRNNGFDQVELASRAAADDGTLAGGARAVWKHQGLPGHVAAPAFGAALATVDVIADARAEHRAGAATARELGYVFVEHQVLRDPMAELGLGAQDRGYLTLAAGASSTWSVAFGAHGAHRVVGGVEARGERFRDGDRAGTRAALVGTRATAAASLGADLVLVDAPAGGPGGGGALVVTPAVRLDALRTAPTPMTEGPDAFADHPPRWDVIPSPRLTARALLGGDVALKASAGRYVRAPTLVELFGNRGTILGSPELAAERGGSIDAGVVWAPARARGPIDRVFVEAAAFATRSRDTIALVMSGGFVARALNVGATQSHGGELVASARLARALTATASYTRLATAQLAIDPNLFGKALPRTPGHLLYARAELAHALAGRAAGAWIDAAVQSTSYLDQANFGRVPGRALIGLGARTELAAGLAVVAAVANLGDTRVLDIPADRPVDRPFPTALADLAGYPLPGRSFYLSLEWTR